MTRERLPHTSEEVLATTKGEPLAMTKEDDPLPEHCQYRDEGCELFPSCLNCPLPRCIYDEPGGVKTARKRLRDGEILRLHCEGWKTAELAGRFGVSRRTVERAVAKSRLPAEVSENE